MSKTRTGGAATQHKAGGGSRPASTWRSCSERGRWTIQMWLWRSTATPDTWPKIQLLGSGLGQSGSTRKFGTASAASCAGTVWAGRYVAGQASRAPRAIAAAADRKTRRLGTGIAVLLVALSG